VNAKTPEETYDAIRAHINGELRQLPAGVSIAFSPPAIPGVGTSGGVTFILEDRGGHDVRFLADNTNAFMEAARKRPSWRRCLLPCWRLSRKSMSTLSEIKSWPKASI